MPDGRAKRAGAQIRNRARARNGHRPIVPLGTIGCSGPYLAADFVAYSKARCQRYLLPWQQAESGAGQDYLVQHIKGAKKHVIKGSSHSTLFDGTEENCRVVAAFLKGEF